MLRIRLAIRMDAARALRSIRRAFFPSCRLFDRRREKKLSGPCFRQVGWNYPAVVVILDSNRRALLRFQWVGGIRSLPASSRQPKPEFAPAVKYLEVPPDQLFGVVRSGYSDSVFRAALGRIRPPNPSSKNHLVGRSMEWVVMRAGCRWSGLFADAGGIPFGCAYRVILFS
jgi:hypothetical protein